jgi:diguanylate cyclase (GGDEF)-like protein
MMEPGGRVWAGSNGEDWARDRESEDYGHELDAFVSLVGANTGADAAWLAIGDAKPDAYDIVAKWGSPIDDGAALVDALSVPVHSGDGTTGAVGVGFAHQVEDRGEIQASLRSHALLARLFLEDPVVFAAALRPADRDQLSGCLTHPALRLALEREVGRCERSGQALSCCCLGIEALMRLNGEDGRLARERLLAEIGRALRERTRQADLVGSYGGGEFVIVLPDVGTLGAAILASRLRSAVSASVRAPDGSGMVVSVGTVEWEPGVSAGELLEATRRDMREQRASGAGPASGSAPA